MTFRGMVLNRSKICINNWILEQINTFNYLGCNISYKGERDLNIQIVNIAKILGDINQLSNHH
jgi:hypothetical protein